MATKLPHASGPPTKTRLDLAVLLFLTLLGSYAYFWQSRDWNSATRLMLTYALVDRHEVQIDGLERHAGQREFNAATHRFEMVGGDLAQVGPHYYTDKAPGQSLLGAIVYAIAKLAAGLPDHPLYEAAFPYWPVDYLVTLGTSGLLTAALGVVIYAFSLRLGATHLGAVLLGLAYGLGTPAFVYATLFYGHQASAFCLATSFFLLYRAAHEGRANVWNMLMAGLLAGYSVVVEYQTAGISALLALYAVLAIRRVRPVFTFSAAAVLAAGLLAAYNYRAFGDPLELSYAHEVSREFQSVHSADNPFGLRVPAWPAANEILRTLLWGRFRGVSFYAPILIAAPLGLLVLVGRKHWGVALLTLGAFAWMLLVNVSYPLWQGGWCTGPRFLLPGIPFAILAVSGLIGVDRRGVLASFLGLLTLGSSLLMLGCVAVGGRLPSFVPDPVRQIVLPHWRGEIRGGPIEIAGGRQFEWNVGRWLIEHLVPCDWLPDEPSPWQGLQMVPLAVFWLVMAGLIIVKARRNRDRSRL